MKFGVVVFPGSNCDQDMIDALGGVLKQNVVKLWHKDTDLQGVDFVVLPGGFSYGDYLRSGAIARFSPIMTEVINHANRGGYVMGVCNGFQILCEAGLTPGALLHNNTQKFMCKNVYIKKQSNSTIITQNVDAALALKIPIAHGEGRYFDAPDAIKKLNDNDQVLFRYCDAQGSITKESNPNGSLENIAGVTNAGKNVFGMMPHPERAVDTNLLNTDGLSIFNGLLQLGVLS
ncbi:MAG: phosphoribosylformylglycinamidine synthase subunit PurQ [Bacteroidia bacterium]|nr:phosphoribosylformylglycinamidine synthase subunit PurQ [Bacteroidia bacterium]